MFHYNGSQYNQLIPNFSNISTNSTQLGGIESGLYATKEYVDGNKLQKFQIIELPSAEQYAEQLFSFDEISDFKYIQIYFYGAYSKSTSQLGMYIGESNTEIFGNLNWREQQTLIIYGFVNGSNVLFTGFGGSSYNKYFTSLKFVSISKDEILSKGINWGYLMEGTDSSYLFHMVF